MSESNPKEVWASGAAYEPYTGRWSRMVAKAFLAWLDVPPDKRWLDIGCGTGALTQTVLALMSPAQVKGIDRSEGFIQYARAQTHDERASFEVGDAQALPVETGSYDVAISGLMLNFVSQPSRAAEEMARAVKSDATVGAYVWDYSDKMEFMRYFWNAAVALEPDVAALDQGTRFPLCNPQALTELFQKAGLTQVEARAIDIPTHFKDFDDYWTPFLGGQGAAPSYVMGLSEEQRDTLRERIRAELPVAPDGSIPMIARAWAVRGVQ